MSRISIDSPSVYPFHIFIKVRVDDLNYGNHLSNDCYLKYMHEARMQFLKHLGLSEMDLGGCSVIMGDAAIRFQQECFFDELIRVEVAAANFGKRSFDLFYRFTKEHDGSAACEAKTGMVCFDYETRKTVAVPDSFIRLVGQPEV